MKRLSIRSSVLFFEFITTNVGILLVKKFEILLTFFHKIVSYGINTITPLFR